ncbi:MAG: hypothetical protein AB1665_08425 [Candidatus Thermoplasmatota archaeon]
MKRLIALLMLALLLQGCAQGAEHTLGYEALEVHTSIHINGYEAWTMHVEPGDVLIVELWVDEGAADFYLTNLSGYLAYRNAPPGVPVEFYYVGGAFSSPGAQRIEYLYTIAVRDVLVVIVDNSNRTAQGASPTGALLLSGRIELHERFWSSTTILITVGVVIATLVIMVWAVCRWRDTTMPNTAGQRRATHRGRGSFPAKHPLRRKVRAKERKVLSRKRRMRVR